MKLFTFKNLKVESSPLAFSFSLNKLKFDVIHGRIKHVYEFYDRKDKGFISLPKPRELLVGLNFIVEMKGLENLSKKIKPKG